MVLNSTGTSSTASAFALNNTGNTFSGSITVNGNGFTDGADTHGGLFGINGDGSLGNTANGITLNNGGALTNMYSPSSAGGWPSHTAYTLAATRTITMGSGVGGVIRTGYGDTVTINSLINGTGALAIVDSGTVILGNANTFSGDTSVSGSSLQLANSLALQNSSLAAGGLSFATSVGSHAFTLGGLKTSSDISLNDGTNAVAFSVGNNNASTTYSAALSNTGSLTKIGTGTLTLAGANSYTGGTTINGGTLIAGARGLGTGSVNVGPSGALSVNQSGSVGLVGLYFNDGSTQATQSNYTGTLGTLAASLATKTIAVANTTTTLNLTSTASQSNSFPTVNGTNPSQQFFEGLYSGMLKITTAGTYSFRRLNTDDNGAIFIDGQAVVAGSAAPRLGSTTPRARLA